MCMCLMQDESPLQFVLEPFRLKPYAFEDPTYVHANPSLDFKKT